ncbi:MAG: glycosyltransferase family 2 protein [Fervidicoccaceae archaeon]
MVWPKVSLIWLNYNSKKIIDIVLESLESVVSMDYPSEKYELIVVDNGSVDGSFESIKNFLDKKSGFRKKIIKLDKNLGFTGGNNKGYRARDGDSKYVLLLNNDAIIREGGLKSLVEYAENMPLLGAVQGIVLRYKSNLIDTSGGYISELLHTSSPGAGEKYPWILKKPVYVSYADGACVLYRIDAVKKCCSDKLFIDEFFGYGDDNVLGLMLWNHGFPSASINKVVAEHLRSSTFGERSILTQYLSFRNMAALTYLSNTRYKRLFIPQILLRLSFSCVKYKNCRHIFKASMKNGIRLGKLLKKKGLYINIYKALLIEIDAEHIQYMFMPRRILEKYYKKWFIKNLGKLEIES